MKALNRNRLLKGAAAAVVALVPLLAAAFPTQPITLVVPFPPGGGNDQVGRLVGEYLSKELDVPVVIENKGGAGGNIGTATVARATPDGYKIAIASNQVVINTSLYSNVGFDLHKDLRPVAMVADVQFLLVSNPTTGLKSVQDILSRVMTKGEQINHGTPGNGTPQHLSAELFGALTGAKLTHVPYRGSGPAIADTLGGHIQLAFGTLPAVAPHVQAQKLNAIAVTGKARSSLLPDVPTLAEAGVKGYESSTWYGILAPAKTPDDIVTTLSNAIKRVSGSAEFQEKLSKLGYDTRYLNAKDMDAVMKADEAKWAKIIKDVGIKIE
ncbi:MAG TPA: tripartite tricarboxylate transporter substrate binding protein [Burkholderiaceae bacterium]|nr:tripartite tricarboxylate transporter substrate binding protein [Burkholderiaceae bacterium]